MLCVLVVGVVDGVDHDITYRIKNVHLTVLWHCEHIESFRGFFCSKSKSKSNFVNLV